MLLCRHSGTLDQTAGLRAERQARSCFSVVGQQLRWIGMTSDDRPEGPALHRPRASQARRQPSAKRGSPKGSLPYMGKRGRTPVKLVVFDSGSS